MNPEKIHKLDRGIKSRKLWLVIFSQLLALFGLILTRHYPETAAHYSTFVGCIEALCAIYCAGNASVKYAAIRHGKSNKPAPPSEPEPLPPGQ